MSDKNKSLRASIAANVTHRLTGELSTEDRIAQVQALLKGLSPKQRRHVLRDVDVVKELRTELKSAKGSAATSKQEVTDAIVAFMYFKGMMGKDASLESLRAEVEKDLPKARQRVQRQLEALTRARMEALATEKAHVLLNDPESVLRGIIEADENLEDELPEDDEWEEDDETDKK